MGNQEPICTEDLSIFSSANRNDFIEKFISLDDEEKIRILRILCVEESVKILSELPISKVQKIIQKIEAKGLDSLASHLSHQLGFIHSEAEPDHDYLTTTVIEHVKERVGWIVMLALLGIVSGVIISQYEDTISQLILLAVYMPVIAAAGGNTGSQAATLVVRSLATNEIGLRDWFKVLWKESQIALWLASILSTVIIMRVLLFTDSSSVGEFSIWMIAVAIAIALFIQVTISTVVGGLLPIFARALRLDPAVLVSPVLASIVDISGIWIYFNVVSYVLDIN
ncbi:magnesium transporter [Vibrio astriarenae]|uniref:Magnesium transporter n=1 Tax=Vibrio astriarenae TaxID=1481923 RepID=A0A7Z2YGC9_9VIBR|nr:magnesium transporter [Vibrio astriarenae]QIA66094.1 magnesium transporter [Vibrio astriarenae]